VSLSRHFSRLRVAALAVAMLAPIVAAHAQDPFDAKSAAHVRDRYLADMDTLHKKVLALANAIPADKYSWRPSKDVRTVSEVFMHIAGEWYYFMPMAFAAKPPAGFVPKDTVNGLSGLEKTRTTKPQVLAELEKAWTHGRNEIATADVSKLTGTYKPWNITIDDAANVMGGDLHEHLGQLIVYARSIGVKPPWTK
jgi:uncharacterized damage-inducible protein DinB